MLQWAHTYFRTTLLDICMGEKDFSLLIRYADGGSSYIHLLSRIQTVVYLHDISNLDKEDIGADGY